MMEIHGLPTTRYILPNKCWNFSLTEYDVDIRSSHHALHSTKYLLKFQVQYKTAVGKLNTLRTGSFKLFKLFKRPLPGFLIILTLKNAELNPICYLLALLVHHFLHVSRIRVNQLLYCVSLKIYNKFANYFCELKFSGNTHQRP